VTTGPSEPLAGVWQQLGLLSRGGRRSTSSAPTLTTPDADTAGAR
jgi:hypothetical protein